MVRDVEGRRGEVGEALVVSPSHVLEGHEGTVARDEAIEATGANHDVAGLGDNVAQDVVDGGLLGVVAVGEDGREVVAGAAADAPLGADGRVDVALDVVTLEVAVAVTAGDLSKRRARHGALVRDAVDVEARVLHAVDAVVGALTLTLTLTLPLTRRPRRRREGTLWRRKGKVLAVVRGLAAGLVLGLDGGDLLGLVAQQMRPVGLVGGRVQVELDRVIADDGVVDVDTLEVEVLRVVLLEEAIGNVRHVHAGVRLARHVGAGALELEGVDKVLPEAAELGGHVVLAGGRGLALGEAGADGLLDPQHVGQAVPRVGVLDWRKGTILP